MKKSPPIKESQILRAILDYLAAKRHFFYRQNSGAFRKDNGSMYFFGAKGSPDIVVVIEGKYVGIEVKNKSGKLSESQEVFRELLCGAGGKYIVARSIDDLILEGI